MKKVLSFIVALVLALPTVFAVSCSARRNETATPEGVVYRVLKDETMFSSADRSSVAPSSADATITLDGSVGSISDSGRGFGGSSVEIKKKGVYLVRGSSENVRIVVDETERSGATFLILDGVNMTSDRGSCISVKSADKLIIYAIGNNYLTVSGDLSASDPSLGDNNGAICSKADLTINGESDSNIVITSSLKGIVAKDDLKFSGSHVIVNAESHGIDANDSVRVCGGKQEIGSRKKEGVYIKNSDGNSFFYMEDGIMEIVSALDGVSVKGAASKVAIAGGKLSVESGGGHSASKNPSLSAKGVKCDGNIMIGNAFVSASSADDCLNAGISVSLTDGTTRLFSSDDGVHADNAVSVSGGQVEIIRSFEGLEARVVSISGGTLSIISDDDGINASGEPSDGADKTNRQSADLFGKITISGGKVYVDSSADGLESKGPIRVTGGAIVVEAGKSAFNKGEGAVASITGGTVLAIGSSLDTKNFDSGAQCSAFVALSGEAGTTIAVNDGSGFSFETTKNFDCLVYSSPFLKIGNSYRIGAGESFSTVEFSNSYYYSDVVS